MPLIVVVGGPCSGKTTIANKLKEFIEKEKGKKVIHINEELVGVNKIEFYKDSTVEKIIRAKLKSNVEKNLDDKTFVIMDSLNYIKGYRYELYCLVRTYMTRHCVVRFLIKKVYCKTDLEICLKLNNNSVYPEDLLKDLYSRMEEPNPHSIFLLIKDRWDNPMVQINFGEEINYEGIYSNLIEGKKPRDPVSTKNVLFKIY